MCGCKANRPQVATMLGLGTFRVEIPGAFAALCRLHRRRPRWFLAAESYSPSFFAFKVIVWSSETRVPAGGS